MSIGAILKKVKNADWTLSEKELGYSSTSTNPRQAFADAILDTTPKWAVYVGAFAKNNGFFTKELGNDLSPGHVMDVIGQKIIENGPETKAFFEKYDRLMGSAKAYG